jgi:hypothetical protein
MIVFVYFSILIFSIISERSYSLKWISSFPLKCIGKYCPNEKQSIDTIFLGKPQLDIEETSSEKEIDNSNRDLYVCDVVPLVLSQKFPIEKVLQSQISFLSFDDGLYDGLPSYWFPSDEFSMKKRNFYNFLQTKSPSINSVQKYLQQEFGIIILALFVETLDQTENNSLSLGGGILLGKISMLEDDENQNQDILKMSELKFSRVWDSLMSTLSRSTSTAASSSTSSYHMCYCSLEEMISLSYSLEMPIFIPKELFDRLSFDALLLPPQISSSTSFYTGSSALLFPTIIAQPYAAMSSSIVDVTQEPKKYPIAWEIRDPKLFFQYSIIDKRAILRLSGMTQKLPRPSLGAKWINELLLQQMDSAVRSEVIRLQQQQQYDNDDDDIDEANNGWNDQSMNRMSKRQLILQEIGKALSSGQENLAQQLQERFELLTSLKANPTLEEGTYDRYLDQDEWYYLERQKAMKKKSTS